MKKSTRSSARSDGSSQAAVPGLIVCLVAMGIAAIGFLLPYQRSESFLSLSVGNSSSLYLAGSLLITLAAPLAILVASIVALTSANARIKCTPIALGASITWAGFVIGLALIRLGGVGKGLGFYVLPLCAAAAVVGSALGTVRLESV